MPEKSKFRDRFIREKVVSKYFPIYHPYWNFNSYEERGDFLQLFFRVINEYGKRFTKRIGFNDGQDNDQELEAKFISKYADNLKKMWNMGISALAQKVYDDYIEFLVDDHIFTIQEEILEQCRMNPESPYSKFQMSLVERDRGNYEEALSITDGFLAEEPVSITFMAVAGSIYEKMGKYEIALSKYDRAYKLTARNLGTKISETHFPVESHFLHDREFLLLYRIRCCIAIGSINQALKNAAILDQIIDGYLTDDNSSEFGFTAGEIQNSLYSDGAGLESLCPEEYKRLFEILGRWQDEYTIQADSV